MNALLLLAAVAAQSGESTAPLKFDALTIEQAARLDGRAVSITFIVDAPAYTIGEGERLVTVVGPADRGDGAVRPRSSSPFGPSSHHSHTSLMFRMGDCHCNSLRV